jgi:DNA-binding HxlR family transcriptional regulator
MLAPPQYDGSVAATNPTPHAHDEKACDGAIRLAFDFLGKRWNGVILGTLMNGTAGFAELRRAIDGISDSMLSDRLTELAEADLVRRTVDPGPPVTVRYELTEAGLGLLPALNALAAWAEANFTP